MSRARFTDLFIQRPVLALVISLAMLVLGLRSFGMLPVFQFPQTQNAVITVSTTYYGAAPGLVAGFITTPLESAIAQTDGIDTISSASTNSLSTITVNLQLNYDADKALTEMTALISSALDQLPPETQRPVTSISIGQTVQAMYFGFFSDEMPANSITDYLLREVQPRLQAVEGVQNAHFLGGKTFALRAWLDPQKMAAYDLTATDISTALSDNDFLSSLGNTRGMMVQINLDASTNLTSAKEFRELVLKQSDDALVRLKDVATVVLGSEDYESEVGFDGKTGVYIGIEAAPTANLLSVVKELKAIFPDIQSQLPRGMTGVITYDSTVFVDASIKEVNWTLAEAFLVIIAVILAFLGSPRSVLIPVVAIPLSLIATFTILLVLGFSINLLTLLALVLAIGLVVDDAIIVVENVNRHIEDGLDPTHAAIQAARELAGPIIAMTLVLISVFVPIGFEGGLTGALFTEFAFTLVGAVTVSAIVALTLSPMMCSRLLRKELTTSDTREARIVRTINRAFETIRKNYARRLKASLNFLPVTVVFAICVLASIYFLYTGAKHELAPQEDQGVIITTATGAPDSTLDQRRPYTYQMYEIFSKYPQMEHLFQMDVPGSIVSGMVLVPWDQRTETASELQPQVQRDLNAVAGLQVAAFQPPSLPGSSGLPIQFVITTTLPFDQLNAVSQDFLQEALKSGYFSFLNTNLRIDLPQSTLEIDRDKAAVLGLSMQDIGDALSSMLGGGYVNYFSMSGRSYKVIPQSQQRFRLNADQLLDYQIRTASGASIPISTFATISTKTTPESLNHFQQLNAATIEGVPAPGVSTGEALNFLNELKSSTLPFGYAVDYAGPSRQYMYETSGFVALFGFALIIIFLALAAKFESFRDPLVILVSVPMSIGGALIFVSLGVGGASLNIYTQVGLVTLMGLISKHGILIVEFANNLQKQGVAKRQAIEQAAEIRLRPILMTTAAMVLGVVPLLTASGAGAEARFNLGLVIASGLTIGTVITLFIVPAVYMLVGADHSGGNPNGSSARP